MRDGSRGALKDHARARRSQVSRRCNRLEQARAPDGGSAASSQADRSAGLPVLCSSRTPVAVPPGSCRLPESVIRHVRPADPAGRATSRSARAGQPQRPEGAARPSRPRSACRAESHRLKTDTKRADFGSHSPPTPQKSARAHCVGSAPATRTKFETPLHWEASAPFQCVGALPPKHSLAPSGSGPGPSGSLPEPWLGVV